MRLYDDFKDKQKDETHKTKCMFSYNKGYN